MGSMTALGEGTVPKRSCLRQLAEWVAAGADHELAPDVAFAVACLAASYFFFFRDSPLWEDQSIYEYMAWGVSHGLVLYRDVINMNWPGAVLLHMLGRAIDPGGPGLRLLECIFLGLLCLSTSIILRAFRVGAAVRLAALAMFLVAYFELGPAATAQRESFMTPLVAVASIPWLVSLSEQGLSRAATWAVGGICAALAVIVKPVAAAPVLAAASCTVLFFRGERPLLFRRGLVFALAAAITIASCLLFLCIWGDLPGFYRWGIQYAFGPYASVRHTPARRMAHFRAFLLEGASLGLVGWLALCAILWFAITLRPFVMRGWRSPDGGNARTILAPAGCAFALIIATAWSIYVQGKTHCGYHFVPLKWALALGGGLLCARLALRQFPRWFEWIWAVGLAAGVQPLFNQASKQTFPSTDHMARALRESLRPNETIVLFGITPSLLWKLERKTPFPYVDSAILYGGAGRDTAFQRQILLDWRRALERPNVRFFLVERDWGSILTGGILSEEIVARHFPEPVLRELGFERTTRFQDDRWDSYERP
jgi:hypothetical protein